MSYKIMELHLQYKLSVETVATILALLLFLNSLLRWKNKDVKKKPPQPCCSWPVIGHLHLLGVLPHQSLGKLADKYGSIFMLKLGVHRAVVVSSPEMAKECLSTNDKVLVNRPHSIVVEHLGYNSAMFGFSPFGPYWREMRKITTVEVLSNHRLHLLRHLKIREVRSGIKAIFYNCQASKRSGAGSNIQPVDMKKWFSDITLNTSVRFIAGKSLKEFYQGEEYERCKKALRDFFELAGAFVPADALPFLRWLDIGGYEKAMKKAAIEIDDMAQGWLDVHKRRKINGHDHHEEEENKDFMDVMLRIISTGLDVPFIYDADSIVKATCIALILGGTDTTAVTLTWALSLLINNKNALKKAQEELDVHVGKQRQVNESDLKNLVYLQAILKETMRLYPAAPLSVPREAIKDFTVSGYHIAAGTRLFVNLYKIHRDPKAWSNPLEFHPERFFTTHKDYDVRGQHFDLIPFGSGRRVCPGISFALQTMQFTLANLLHGFEISTQSDETVDMTEGFGMTNLKASPLDVILIPRLPEILYDDNHLL